MGLFSAPWIIEFDEGLLLSLGVTTLAIGATVPPVQLERLLSGSPRTSHSLLVGLVACWQCLGKEEIARVNLCYAILLKNYLPIKSLVDER